jgi:hypothetical protein
MKRVLLAIAGALALYGCGGGGGGAVGSSNGAGSDLKIGKFVDSAVENVRYVTETQVGFTQQDGSFFYKEGEAIEFFIGKQSLGRTQAQGFVTPYELIVENANSPSEITAIRIGQVLQSFDADDDPSNGVKINNNVHQRFVAGQISFTDTQSNFESSFAGSLANSNAKLVNFNDAKTHLELVFQKFNDEYDKNCQIPIQTYRIQSVGSSESTSIDTTNFDCANRHKVAYYAQGLQQVLVSDLNLNSTSLEIITEAGSQEELYVGGEEYKKSALGGLVLTIDVLVDTLASSLNIIDSKTLTDYAANASKLALNAVSFMVKHDPNEPKDVKEREQKKFKFASALIGVLADGANCGTGKTGSKFKNKACTDAVFAALKMIEPSVSLATTDPNALAVLEEIGALLDATSKIAGDPSKTRSALVGFASESTRILGNTVIKASVSDEAGLQTVLTESVDAVTKSTKGYFDCLKSADLKGCKDRVLNDTIEYLSKGVFRAGIIINLDRLEGQRDALYMTDYILQQYLLNKSDIYKVYAAYGIPIEYEKNCLIFVCLIDQDVINEREMFYKLVRKLSASNINSSWVKRESPYTADTWEKFNEYKTLLEAISQSEWLDDAQLSMSAELVPNANQVDFQIKTSARLSTFACEAVGANGDAFGGPAGSAFKTKIGYSTPGLYTVACTGINGNGEIVLKRKISFTLSNCPTSATMKLGQCITSDWLSWDGESWTKDSVKTIDGGITNAREFGGLIYKLPTPVDGDNSVFEIKARWNPSISAYSGRDIAISLDNRFGSGQVDGSNQPKITRSVQANFRTNGWSDIVTVNSDAGPFQRFIGTTSTLDWRVYKVETYNGVVNVYVDGVLKYTHSYSGRVGALDTFSAAGLAGVAIDPASLKVSKFK